MLSFFPPPLRLCRFPLVTVGSLAFLGAIASPCAVAASVNVAGYITNPNGEIGAGNSAILTAASTFGWQTSDCSIPVATSGFLLTLDSGNGNPYNYTGAISGGGGVEIVGGGSEAIRLGGSSGNTYTGNSSVTKGVVRLEKASGNALSGNITVTNSSSVVWNAADQINDTSNVTLTGSGNLLDLAGRSDTIGELRLATGSTVQTGAGGILKVTRLFLNGMEQPAVARGPGNGYVLGTGYIDVGNSGPPVISDPPTVPASPSPVNLATTIHPATFVKFDWADSANATGYDLYLWPASGTKPVSPTASVVLSEYAPPSDPVSVESYKWQVVAKNTLGSTNGPEWTFSTLARWDVSGLIEDPNDWVGIGNTANLVGDAKFDWKTSNCAIPVVLNGFTLTMNSGGGNPYNYTGSITGDGGLTLEMVIYGSNAWDDPRMRIGGNAGNSYTGPTIASYGSISLEKTNGDALCGTITVGSHGDTARLIWNNDDQIADDSQVSLLYLDVGAAGYPARGTFLDLNGHSDTIAALTLEPGNTVQTGQGGVLTMDTLTIGGTLMGSGTYTAATHGFIAGTGSLVVREGGGSGFEMWAAAKGITGSNAAFNADPDGDGLPNAIEFVLGSEANPANPGAHSLSNRPSAIISGEDLIFTFHRQNEAAYLLPTVEFSESLTGSWTPCVDSVNSSISITPGTPADIITVAVPRDGSGQLFARLKVVTTAEAGGISPRITTSPGAATIIGGENFTLSADAGGAKDVSWQWYLNGVAITGATSRNYAVTGADFSDQGNYHVVVTNASGNAMSTSALVTITVTPGENGLNLIPWPLTIQPNSGTLAITPTARIVATHASLVANANALASEISAAHGRTLPVVTSAAVDGDIVLTLDGSIAGERHTLAVDTRATVKGKDAFAVSMGTTSLLQALRIEAGALVCPKFTMDDQPAVGIRALALDLARFDHSMESLFQAVDLCRLYKINYLHLHFNDDQTYTFPSAAFPLLNTVTTSRGRLVYTLAEMQALEAYAIARGVHIMPEFEMPGHCALMLAAYPSLFKITYPHDPNSTDPNYPKYEPSSSINIAKAEVRAAVRTLIGEMCAVFQSTPYIHLGCDEVDWAWSEHSTDFQNVFAEWGFNRPDPRENVHLVFSKFITIARDYAAEFGKKTIVWENGAITGSPEVPTPTDVLVMPFDSYNPTAFTNQGLKLVNAAWSPLYVVGDLKKPVSSIYAWDRTIFGQYSGESDNYNSSVVAAEHVIGTQLTTFEQEEDMEMMSTRRRLAAMSERTWNPDLGASFQNFSNRLAATDSLLDSILSPVRITYSGMGDADDRVFSPSATATMSLAPGASAQGLTIRYTTNRTNVTNTSPLYTGPIQLTASGYLRAAAFNSSGQRVGRMVRELHRRELPMIANLAAGKPVTASSGTNASMAVDLQDYQGWRTDLTAAKPSGENIVIDLQSAQNVNRISLLFAPNYSYYYRVELSLNGSSWSTVVNSNTVSTRAGITHDFTTASARYVRLTLLPHEGANGDKTVQEIIVTGT